MRPGKRVMLVGGARPNFVKLASVFSALRAADSFELIFVHTGQHYDEALSGTFLRQLDLPAPDALLGIGSGTHAGQTARIMLGFEEVVERVRPEAVVLVGDVNSTLACALVVAKLDFGVDFLRCGLGSVRRPVIVHVEAGLRSFDWTMPEEINRVVTDRLSDLAVHDVVRSGRKPEERRYLREAYFQRRQRHGRYTS